MDLEALRHGNFATLGTAIDDWTKVVGYLKGYEKDAREDLKAKADRAEWAGVNAAVSRQFISKTAGEFADALAQATSIRDILRDTRDELVQYRAELNRAIDRGWEKKLSVVGERGGGFRVFVNVHPEPPNSEQAVKDLRDELQGILTKAATSDSTASRVLRAIAEQADYGFSGVSYKDRDSAAGAMQRADDLAKLAKDPEKMSDAQLREFNATLAKYKDDQLFSARFATQLGAEGTLRFWTEMSDIHMGARDGELKRMEEFQKNLSMTLATATLSDADAMQAWKKDLVDQSNKNFVSDAVNVPGRTVGAYGYQVISSLMHHGKYDAEFLDAYGKQLLKQDMAPAGPPGIGSRNLWHGDNHQLTDLVFGKGDGRDPLVGFMDALSHNAEAATNTFDDKKALEHVLESTRYTDRDASVGRALEAAVMGVGVGEKPDGPAPHTATQVGIMKNVMHMVAQPDGGSDLVSKGLGDSFGNMASAYMPEISRTIAGEGAESIFLTDSEAPNELDPTDTTRFLYEVSQDPNGRAGIIVGQSVYTSSLLEAHIANPSLYDGGPAEAVRTISESSGVIQGIVGHANADAAVAGELASEKDQNDAVKTKGDLFKGIAGAGIGVAAAAFVPQGMVGGVIGATAGGYFGGIAGIAIDRLMEGQQAQGALDRALYQSGRELNDYQSSVRVQTQQSAVDAIEKYGADLPPEATKNQIREAVNEGWTESDRILEDAHARPAA
ncbi:hypothetical protein ACIGW0_00075 [Streptomyces bikiniensis]|uniref:Glycine zipper domain-containing protein n=1 Tax=Streptomyces bikiniensis TaxID=1896 RepID=A0ABW8CKW5_STRBI